MLSSILKTIGDILSGKVILFVLKVTFFSLVATITLMWKFWDIISLSIAKYLSFMPYEWMKTSSVTLLNLIFSYMLFLSFISILTSVFSEDIIREIIHKYYPDRLSNGQTNITKVVFINLKANLLFLILFILAIPFLFIPLIGQIIMLYLWSIQIKTPIEYDVGSILGQGNMKTSRSISLIASSFNYIPFLSIFSPLFASILFLHEFMRKK